MHIGSQQESDPALGRAGLETGGLQTAHGAERVEGLSRSLPLRQRDGANQVQLVAGRIVDEQGLEQFQRARGAPATRRYGRKLSCVSVGLSKPSEIGVQGVESSGIVPAPRFRARQFQKYVGRVAVLLQVAPIADNCVIGITRPRTDSCEVESDVRGRLKLHDAAIALGRVPIFT